MEIAQFVVDLVAAVATLAVAIAATVIAWQSHNHTRTTREADEASKARDDRVNFSVAAREFLSDSWEISVSKLRPLGREQAIRERWLALFESAIRIRDHAPEATDIAKRALSIGQGYSSQMTVQSDVDEFARATIDWAEQPTTWK